MAAHSTGAMGAPSVRSCTVLWPAVPLSEATQYVPLPDAGSGHPGPVTQCCCCAKRLDTAEPGALTIVVTAAGRMDERSAPTQQLWTHAACLAARLDDSVPFDPEGLDD